MTTNLSDIIIMQRSCIRILSIFGHSPHDARDISIIFECCSKALSECANEFYAIRLYLENLDRDGLFNLNDSRNRAFFDLIASQIFNKKNE